MPRICVTGAPGSGKSTLAAMLASRLELPYMSTGDVAREWAKMDGALALQLASGALAPRDKMDNFVLDTLNENQNLVLDGYPRYKRQLTDSLQFKPIYIWVDTPLSVCLTRLVGRDRPEDHGEAVLTRMKLFVEETQPIFLDMIQRESATDALTMAGAIVIQGWRKFEPMIFDIATMIQFLEDTNNVR